MSQLAMALAQLNASNMDAAVAADGSEEAAAAPADKAAAAHPAAGAAASSEQQQAAAEAARVLLGELCDVVQTQTSMDAASLAMFVGAMARLGHYSWPAMRHVCSSLLPAVVHDLTPASITQLLVGCTKLQHYDQQLCEQLAAAAERCMPQATCEQVARVVWSLTHQRHEQPGVYEAAARQVRLRGVARALPWGCVTLTQHTGWSSPLPILTVCLLVLLSTVLRVLSLALLRPPALLCPPPLLSQFLRPGAGGVVRG